MSASGKSKSRGGSGLSLSVVGVYAQALGMLLTRPESQIPRLASQTRWSFPIVVLVLYAIAFIFPYPWVYGGPDGAAISTLEYCLFILLLPLSLVVFTYAGLRLLLRTHTTFLLCMNAVAITLFPFMAGMLVAFVFNLVDHRLFFALFIFSVFYGALYYVEALRLVHGLDRMQQIYFAPLVLSVSITMTFFIVQLLHQFTGS